MLLSHVDTCGTMWCVGGGWTCRRARRVSPLVRLFHQQQADAEAPIGSACELGEGGKEMGRGGQKGEADREGSKGLTTRSLVFQVMDMHVLV